MSTHDDARPPAGPGPRRADEVPGSAAEGAEGLGPEGAKDRAQIDPRTLRRAPRYGRFAFTGFLVGALAALLLAFLPGVGAGEGTGTLFFFLLLALGSGGALLGALGAVLAERRSLRRRPARSPRRP